MMVVMLEFQLILNATNKLIPIVMFEDKMHETIGLGWYFLFFRNLFSGLKNRKNRIPENFFFFLCFPEEFFTGTWFWRGSQEFLFFADITGFFCRNSCGAGIPVFSPDSSGILQIPPDSSGFLRIPVPAKHCLALASD